MCEKQNQLRSAHLIQVLRVSSWLPPTASLDGTGFSGLIISLAWDFLLVLGGTLSCSHLSAPFHGHSPHRQATVRLFS